MKELLLEIQDIKIDVKSKHNNNDDINNLIIRFENNKPIPLKYYNKELIELKKNKIACNSCKRIGQYKLDNKILCWIHAYSL